MFEFTLPKDFLIGTANSAFQSEGAWDKDGKSMSVIDHYSRLYAGKPHPTTGKMLTEHSPDDGCFFYDNYEAYIEDMQKTGQNVYRLSLAWPRILPDGIGEVNPKGIAFYNKVIDKLISCGITPFVDLLHWDLPMCLQEKGGYVNPEFPEWFEYYARVCFAAFGDRVPMWSTSNEVAVTVGSGYGTGGFPPYVQDLKLKMLGNHHVILSHFRAVRAYREMGFTGQIGIVHAITPVYPADTAKPEDIAAAHRSVLNRFEIYMSPMVDGCYPRRLLVEAPQVLAAMPENFQQDIEKWFAPMDFVGINYYNSARTQFVPDNYLLAKGVENFYTAPGQKFEAYPAGLMDVLTYVWQRYGLPVYISENGMGVETNNMEEEDCSDSWRIEYLREHLRMVSRAIKLGVGVKGYFYWNDADSYETQSGYRYRFGLTWVDRATGRRRWKDSRHYFSKVCKTRMVD